jgi:ATP-dependent exoDNAse (exonuclease V) alpha subunit
MGFKGLERPVIVLAVDGFHEGVAREVMYTGLSRARDQLVVCGDLAQIQEAVGKEVAKRLAAAPST